MASDAHHTKKVASYHNPDESRRTFDNDVEQ